MNGPNRTWLREPVGALTSARGCERQDVAVRVGWSQARIRISSIGPLRRTVGAWLDTRPGGRSGTRTSPPTRSRERIPKPSVTTTAPGGGWCASGIAFAADPVSSGPSRAATAGEPSSGRRSRGTSSTACTPSRKPCVGGAACACGSWEAHGLEDRGVARILWSTLTPRPRWPRFFHERGTLWTRRRG